MSQSTERTLPLIVLVTSALAAKMLNMSEDALRQARVRGNGPKFKKDGRRVYYKVQDLAEWEDAHTMTHEEISGYLLSSEN